MLLTRPRLEELNENEREKATKQNKQNATWAPVLAAQFSYSLRRQVKRKRRITRELGQDYLGSD